MDPSHEPESGKAITQPTAGGAPTGAARGVQSARADSQHSPSGQPDRSALPSHWLKRLESPRGVAVLGIAGLGLSLISLLASANLAALSIASPVALALGAWLTYKLRRPGTSLLMGIAVAVSTLLVVRANATPPSASFYYDGSQLVAPPGSPFADQNGIPLTEDPREGLVRRTLYEAANFAVTCTRAGAFERGHIPVEWAYISNGPYETLWVPDAYLAGLALGTARTLLPCSDWRWQLHYLGDP
jgi:hypothetical protein